MRIVVIGATGNVGTSVVAALGADPTVTEVVGVARRRPTWSPPGVRWTTADVATDDLATVLRGADAVVHLAWLIQPSRDPRAMWATNVVGTRRVVEAVTAADVPVLVALSSIGAYSPAPPDVVVDETWPTDGVPESTYSWQKAHQERALAALAAAAPDRRVVVLRPALIFKREAAHEIRGLFVGPLLPRRAVAADGLTRLLRHSPLPFQCVHTDDVAAAVARSITTEVSGPFNLAADGVMGGTGAHRERWAQVVSPLVAAAWRARAVPVDPGWVRLAASVPRLSCTRARDVLGWRPTRTAAEVTHELLDGLHDDARFPTPPLG